MKNRPSNKMIKKRARQHVLKLMRQLDLEYGRPWNENVSYDARFVEVTQFYRGLNTNLIKKVKHRKPHHQGYTELEEFIVKKGLEQGHTFKSIAKRIGKAESTIYYHAVKMGYVTKAKETYSRAEDQYIIQARKQGKKLRKWQSI